MRNLPLLAARLYNTPLMLLPTVAETFGAVFRDIVAGGAQPGSIVVVSADGQVEPKPHGFAANVAPGERFADKPYLVTDAGVAVLSVTGPLVQRAGQIDANCAPLASYQRLSAKVDAMMADPDVAAILLEWDSPGGEVAGAYALASRLQAVRGTKPVWSHANEGAYSAAYLLASATERIVVPQSGQLGSIGVVMLHVDQSQRDAKQGVVFTPIFAGARKVDFNSHAPLSKEARAIGQAEVDRLYDMFVGHVAATRALDVQAVRATEAGIFAAGDAKAIGLADAVGSFDDTLAELTDLVHVRANGATHFFATAEQRQAARHNPGETTMSQQNGAAPAQPAATPSPSATQPQGVPETVVAQREVAAGTAATMNERTRIAAILRAPEATGRTALAQALAFDSDMAPDAATRLLAVAAQDAPPAPAPAPKTAAVLSPLAAAMASIPNPPIGPDAALEAGADSAESLAASAIALARTVQGVK